MKAKEGDDARAAKPRHSAKTKPAAANGDMAEHDSIVLVHELRVHQLELEMQNEELRRTQHEAELLKEKFEDLYNFAPVGYLTLDARGVVIEANLAAASLLGCVRGNLKNQPLSLHLASGSQSDFYRFLRQLLAGTPGARCEVQLAAKAQRHGWLLLDGGVFGSGEARPQARLALLDISEQKLFEAELLQARAAAEAASRAKGQFLANMSHELRTPMTGVIGLIDFALGEELSPPLRQNLETALNSARSLLRILNDILDMAKIEAGKLTLEEEPFSLRKCVAGVIALLKPEAVRKQIDLVLAMTDDLPEMVVGDEVRLRQILTNLIGNAVKFTDQGKVKVLITAGGTSDDGRLDVCFTINDTGIGIPADKQHLLFGAFSQVDSSDTRKYGGSGLGLAISRELVERMGGSLDYSSEARKGSTFTFRIPFEVSVATPATTVAGETPVQEDVVAVAAARPRLLVAEDDATITRVVKIMFSSQNIDAEFAANGIEVVEKWRQGDYDLILMDVQMPHRDGLEATRIIREEEQKRGGHTPIIAMTAHAFREDESRCLAAGMDAYVSKPINMKECVEKIRKMTGNKTLRT